MRKSVINRNTAETQVSLSLNLDGDGAGNIDTGCGFLDHMLTLTARHGRLTLRAQCRGDTYVDYHHTVEDVGICLGQALRQALGDKKGVCRYGQSLLPMDETLMLCGLDLSGRAYLGCDVPLAAQKVGDFDTELFEEFFLALTREAGITLHFKLLSGRNAHHILEAAFKAFGRALRQAAAIDAEFADQVPSTKGVLA